jgi:acyl carrier protein
MNSRETISRFIANEFLDGSEIKNIPDDLDLVESGIVDSLGLLRIVAFLEDEMNVIIEPESMTPEHLSSIGAILSLVAPDLAAGQ